MLGAENIFKLSKDLLTKQDLISLLELIHSSLSCTTEEDLRELITGRFKYLVPHDAAICVLGQKGSNGKRESYDGINISCPNEWLELYVLKQWHKIDPILKENFVRFRLQYCDDTFKLHPPFGDLLPIAHDFGLKHGYTHGVKDPRENKGTLFTISGESVKRDKRTELILELFMPHLHQTLNRILSQEKIKVKPPLTPREIEVLKWVGQGKSTWDISVILRISENTVKFHIKNIMLKLDTSTRTHAVAIAIEQGLIDIE